MPDNLNCSFVEQLLTSSSLETTSDKAASCCQSECLLLWRGKSRASHGSAPCHSIHIVYPSFLQLVCACSLCQSSEASMDDGQRRFMLGLHLEIGAGVCLQCESAFALIVVILEPPASTDLMCQGRTMSTMGATWGCAAVIAPVIGGFLAEPCSQYGPWVPFCSPDELLQRQ